MFYIPLKHEGIWIHLTSLTKNGPQEVTNPDAIIAAVALNGFRKQGLPGTSWVFLSKAPQKQEMLYMGMSLLTSSPPFVLPVRKQHMWGMGETTAKLQALAVPASCRSEIPHIPNVRKAKNRQYFQQSKLFLLQLVQKQSCVLNMSKREYAHKMPGVFKK